jgi:DNA polymerase I-like protein with 3'-5' exonuclease and polymerase domains
VLQVHDEIVGEFEGTKEQALEVAREVKRVMEGRWKLEVPLLCEPTVARNWREGK